MCKNAPHRVKEKGKKEKRAKGERMDFTATNRVSL